MLELEADRHADRLLVSQDAGGDDRRAQDGAHVSAKAQQHVSPLAASWARLSPGPGPGPGGQGSADLALRERGGAFGPLPTEPFKC